MKKTYYFMAGMPRSGSTLLSSILNQNPRFHSGPSSPVLSFMGSLEASVVSNELYKAYPKEAQAKELMGSIIDHYYSDVTKPVVIDKNRNWTSYIPYIEQYIGQTAKIICTIRDISEVLTSFIMLIRRNGQISNDKLNFIDADLVKQDKLLTDDNRCEVLMGPGGVCGTSSTSLLNAIEKFRDKIHLVEYNMLVNNPSEVMKNLYRFLGEPYFEHTFSDLKTVHKELDNDIYGLGDMHDVKPVLAKTAPDPSTVLSAKVLEQCRNCVKVDLNK